MQIADFDHTDFSNPYAKNKVRFSIRPKLNQAKTRELGRPIYEDAEYIEIMSGGPNRVVKHLDSYPALRSTYAGAYNAWKAGQTSRERVSGTLLTAFPGVGDALAKTLEAWGVLTVEDLVDMPDTHVQKIMGLGTIKSRAKRWLESTKSTAETGRLAHEVESLRAQLDAIRAGHSADGGDLQNERVMVDAIADDVEISPKRRGRPPKSKDE